MKKVLPAALVLAMALTAVPAFADTTDTTIPKDVAGTGCETAVVKLLEDHIVSGYKDGSFKPEASITRAEVCAMLIKAGGNPSGDGISDSESEAVVAAFSDLDQAPWAESFILKASEAGIVSGYKDGTFRPANTISINELNVMVGKASGMKADEVAKLWNDAGNVPATRGEAAVAVYDALEKIEAAAEAGYVKEIENEVTDKEEGLGYEVSNATSEFTGTPLVLSLEEAVTKMQTESISAETAELNKKSDQAKAQGYGDSYTSMNEAMKYMDYLPLSTQYTMQQEGLTEANEEILKLQRDFARANIENNYQTEMNQIRLSAIQTYYGLLQANDALRIQEENLQVQQNLLKLTQRKYELGTVSKIDLLTAENAVIKAENDVLAAKNMVAQAKMGVNMLLEQPLMQELELTTRYEALKLPEITLTEAINSAMSQRNELVSAEFTQKVMETNYKSIRYRYGIQSTKYKEAEVQMKQVEQLCQMMPANIEMDIRTRYSDVHAKYQAVQAAQNTLDFAKEGYRIATITYNAGMNTISDVHQAQVGVLGAELGLSSAIAAYNQAVYEFEVAVGTGTERISF
ncbi:MAG: TolC family protein [Firmicutes bacterium]|nr:TolC family protein [Bacillota bacterium]